VHMNNMIGVILAAGKGSRLYPVTEKLPKPLVPIGNKRLLEYHIAMLKEIGIKECIIVVGHFGFEIAKYFGDGRNFGITIKYVEQTKPLGIANALACVSDFIKGPFILILGDIFFRVSNLEMMISIMEEKRANGILATKIENDPDSLKKNFSLDFDKDGKVLRVFEKPKRIINNIKGCGLYLFDENIFEAVNRTPRTALRDEYEITDSVQIFINLGFNVYYTNVVEEDLNITYPRELFYINMDFLKKNGMAKYLAENVKVGMSCELDNVIVCENSVIEDFVTIRDSVIFPDVVVKKGSKIEHAIVTKERVIKI
jgi:NDP-sugar pyrophosphorylase family protein